MEWIWQQGMGMFTESTQYYHAMSLTTQNNAWWRVASQALVQNVAHLPTIFKTWNLGSGEPKPGPLK
jgi:hypothetical protein